MHTRPVLRYLPVLVLSGAPLLVQAEGIVAQARVLAGQHALNLSARAAFNTARRQLLEDTQA